LRRCGIALPGQEGMMGLSSIPKNNHIVLADRKANLARRMEIPAAPMSSSKTFSIIPGRNFGSKAGWPCHFVAPV